MGKQELSRFLSLVLRHHPETLGLELSTGGWVRTDDLLKALTAKSEYGIDLEYLKDVVYTDAKGRYSFKAEGDDEFAFIRANQGHSVKGLVMDFKELSIDEVPDVLYHGTSEVNAGKILDSGEIKPMSRQMVHLSRDIETATKVGKRHGKLAIFRVDCQRAFKDGKKFYISTNGVYLVDRLSTKYIELLANC